MDIKRVVVRLLAALAVASCGAAPGRAQDDAASARSLVARVRERNAAYARRWSAYATSALDYLKDVARRKATCPFVGTAVATGKLPVSDVADAPLARVDEVVRLGNSGGGDLGEVLRVFALGNHAFMPDASGRFSRPVPPGTFSLDFPGSQGSHPGHSGILQGDPSQAGTGRFSQADFDRLTSRASGGWVKRSDVGKFIAEDLARDPRAKVYGARVAGLLAADLGRFVGVLGPSLLARIDGPPRGESGSPEERAIFTALTRTTGEDNLVGSAGEFGLLFAFLDHEPGARRIGGEPAVSTADLTLLFKDHRFPAGWETWPKTRHDWVVDTTALMISAGREYLRLTPAGRP